jgi:Domain of unknown function (DUF4824)
MSRLKKYSAWIAGISIILVTNALALGGAANNRSQAPNSRLVLSERELVYNNYDQYHNSGVALRIDWNVLSSDMTGQFWKTNDGFDSYNYSRNAYWLDDKKLQTLGFDTSKPDFSKNNEYQFKALKNREVFLVLEQNGPSYQRYLAGIKAKMQHDLLLEKDEQRKKEITKQALSAQTNSSRLYAVDAGLDAVQLRKKYPDPTMYAIVKAVIAANWYEPTDGTLVLKASVYYLSVATIHVPKPYDAVFTAEKSDAKAAYEVSLAYGQRYEPWITAAKRLK